VKLAKNYANKTTKTREFAVVILKEYALRKHNQVSRNINYALLPLKFHWLAQQYAQYIVETSC
jgi:hypothetical protein